MNGLELGEDEYKYASRHIIKLGLKLSDSLHDGAVLNDIDTIIREYADYNKRECENTWTA